MHIVEIRHRGADLVATMARMRTWLDHQRIEPSLFEIAFLPGREIRLRLQFKKAADGSAFASVFDGKLMTERDSAAILAA